MAEISLADAQQVLERQPFSRLVGARLTAFGSGRAVVEIDVEERHRQQHGVVHGGLLCYLADNALTFAAGTVLGPGIVTRDLAMRYVEPARDGRLRATADVTTARARLAMCTVIVETIEADGTTTLCAVASGAAAAVKDDRGGRVLRADGPRPAQ